MSTNESAFTVDMTWPEREEIVCRLQANVRATHRLHGQNPEATVAWKTAAALFGKAIDDAYIGEFAANLTALKSRSLADITPLLDFLEADSYFYGSGYKKEEVIRTLKRATFSLTETDRLRQLILRSVRRAGWTTRLFGDYVRIVPRVDSPEFRTDLRKLSSAADRQAAARALQIMHFLKDPREFRVRLAKQLKAFPVLQTPRMILRSLQEDDAEQYVGQISSLPLEEPWRRRREVQSVDRCRTWIAGGSLLSRRSGSSIAWALDVHGIGVVGLVSLLHEGKSATGTLGYWLGNDYWGQGLMTEALTCAVRFAFDNLDMFRLRATTEPQNFASQRVLEKIGFQDETRFYKGVRGEQPENTVEFGLLRIVSQAV